MAPYIVESANAVTLLGGGEVIPKDVKEALQHAPTLVAADGGANVAAQMGQEPVAVIGDMDSADSAARRGIPADRFHICTDQETTDFDKCMRCIHAPLVLGVGFTGARIDHQLAAFSTLLRHPQKRCILVAKEEIIFLAPQRMSIGIAVGCRVSLFPMQAGRVSAKGLRWPLDALRLAADGKIGTSNEASEETVELETNTPGILVLLPRATLGSAIPAILAARLHDPLPVSCCEQPRQM